MLRKLFVFTCVFVAVTIVISARIDGLHLTEGELLVTMWPHFVVAGLLAFCAIYSWGKK